VSDIVTTNVVTISLNEKIDLVDEIMLGGDIHHVPVTQGGTVVSLLSQRDTPCVKFSTVIEFKDEDKKELLGATDVENVMRGEVKFADPNELITHAAKRMPIWKSGASPLLARGGNYWVSSRGRMSFIVSWRLSKTMNPKDGEI
jgi:CBS domain-containing protein